MFYSNTNQIHYDCFINTINKNLPNNYFENLFIKTYYSHSCGFRKPYPESYLKIIEQQQLNKAETLFIDDTLTNVQGATKAGLQTIYLQAPQTVLDLEL